MTYTKETSEPRAKRSKNDNDEELTAEDEDLQAMIVSAWKTENPDVAFASTVEILSTQIDKLIKDGITAFHQAESSQNEVVQLKEQLQRSENEIAGLRAAEEKNSTALSVIITNFYLLLRFFVYPRHC